MNRTSYALAFALLCVAGAIVFHAHMQPRYQISQSQSQAVRLNTRDGTMVACNVMPRRMTNDEENAVWEASRINAEKVDHARPLNQSGFVLAVACDKDAYPR